MTQWISDGYSRNRSLVCQFRHDPILRLEYLFRDHFVTDLRTDEPTTLKNKKNLENLDFYFWLKNITPASYYNIFLIKISFWLKYLFRWGAAARALRRALRHTRFHSRIQSPSHHDMKPAKTSEMLEWNSEIIQNCITGLCFPSADSARLT